MFPPPFFFLNKHLVNHRIGTRAGVDFETCKLYCYHENNCVSVNYRVNTQKCELNNATHLLHDNEFVDKDGYLYHGADVRLSSILLLFDLLPLFILLLPPPLPTFLLFLSSPSSSSSFTFPYPSLPPLPFLLLLLRSFSSFSSSDSYLPPPPPPPLFSLLLLLVLPFPPPPLPPPPPCPLISSSSSSSFLPPFRCPCLLLFAAGVPLLILKTV